jgi:peptide/nickel transport system substrate-binding protein
MRRASQGYRLATWLIGTVLIMVIAAACGETVVKEVPVEVTVEVEKIVEVEKEVEVVKEVPAADQGWLLSAPEPNPKYGGVITTAFGVTTSNFDLAQGAGAGAMVHMYDLLIRKNLSDGMRTISPSLASSWDIASDGMSYTFTVREGVQFHDGKSMSAEDVAASMNRVVFPPEGVTSTAKDNFRAISQIEALDATTLKISLSTPVVWTFDMLTIPQMAVYSKADLDANNQDLKKLIAPGTGAFLFDVHEPAEKWEFTANDGYWNSTLPYVDRLKMLHVPAWIDRGTAILTGLADLTWNGSRDTWEEGQKRADVNTGLAPSFGGQDIVWNNQKAPFDDNRVRRAFFLAINQQQIIKAAREIFYVPGRWIHPLGEGALPLDAIERVPGFRPDPADDIAEAQRLLADAGYPGGEGFPTLDLATANVALFSETLGPVVVDQLSTNLGIDIKMRRTERAQLVKEFKGNFDLVLSNIFARPPILNHTPGWQNTYTTGAAANYMGYSNPEFDAIVDKLSVETDKTKRVDLFRQGSDILDADAPLKFLNWIYHMSMWQSFVKGLMLDNRVWSEWGYLETVWLDK